MSNSLEGLVYFCIFMWVFTIIFTIVLAVKKGYNGFLAFLLGLFIPLLGSLIVVALLPDKREIDSVAYQTNSIALKVETLSQRINDISKQLQKKSEQEIENEKKILELKEKYKGIEDILNDKEFMKEANTFRKLYGKSVYISKIKERAQEIGIEINENDII